MSKSYKLRHFARRRVVQTLYQWQLLGEYQNDLDALGQPPADTQYFNQLLQGTFKHRVAIDQALCEVLDRPLEALTLVELAVLRLGVYELLYEEDIPDKVVINEAIELAKIFGTSDGFKYINGVLDKIKMSKNASKE